MSQIGSIDLTHLSRNRTIVVYEPCPYHRATGTIGRQVVAQLSSSDLEVRAMVRNPDAAHLPPNVQVMQGDLTLPNTLDKCLTDVDTVFLVWTAPASAIVPAFERITKRSRRIVYLSAPLKTHTLSSNNPIPPELWQNLSSA